MNLVFLITHLGSGYAEVGTALSEAPRMQCIDHLDKVWTIDDLLSLSKAKHKCPTKAAMIGIPLLYNYEFSLATAFRFGKFVFLSRKPQCAYGDMSKVFGDDKTVVEHYGRRMRSMCEMFHRADAKIAIDTDELTNQATLDKLSEFLNLKFKLNPIVIPDVLCDISKDTCKQLDFSYRKYKYFMNNINL